MKVLKRIAEQIYKEQNPIEYYNELVTYFEKESFWDGKANILEYIWRLNNNDSLLLEIGNIFLKN